MLHVVYILLMFWIFVRTFKDIDHLADLEIDNPWINLFLELMIITGIFVHFAIANFGINILIQELQ